MVLGRTFVSLTSLQTIVTEIEATLNDRPLTYMSSDVNDPEPLTPAHLLYGRRIVLLQQMIVKLMTQTMVKPLEQACEPGLLNMLKYCNIFNIVGNENTCRHFESTIGQPERMNSVSRLEMSSLCTTTSLERGGIWQ